MQHDTETPSIAQRLRHRLAAQMEGYKDRIASQIRRQRLLHGQEPMEVAYKVGVDKRTYERWEAGQSVPRTSNFRALSALWEVPMSDLRPDLEAEGERLEQLESQVEEIHSMLRQLVGDAEAENVERLSDEATAEASERDEQSPQKPGAASQ